MINTLIWVMAMADVPAWRLKMQQYRIEHDPMPKDAIVANLHQQAENNSYDVKPYYVDVHFTCPDCGKKELWTAKQQQWWYEIAKGNINSGASRCRPCRKKIRDAKSAQKAHMEDVKANKRAKQ